MMSVFYEQKDITLSCFNNVEYLEEWVHCHRELEIVICTDGYFNAYVNSQHYEIKPGNMLVIFPNQIHSYVNMTRGNYCVIIFSSEYIPEIKKIVFENTLENNTVDINEYPEIKEAVSSIIAYNEEEKVTFFTTFLIGYLNILMANLLINTKLKLTTPTNETLLVNILDYCAQNFNNTITLEGLSKALFVSTVKVSALLNHQLSMSLPQLINSMRISNACSLLKNNDLSMTDISNVVGFGSLRSFNRSFLKIVGKTPSEFRNDMHK